MATYINADDGIVSGVAGLKYGADNSGSLVLQTNGTTAISISAAQVVTFSGTVSFATASFTNLSYTGTLTGGTGVVNLGSGQFYKDASGNVGIGTNSPTARLDIRTAAGTSALLNLYTGSNAAASTIQFGQSGAIGWDVGITATTGNFLIGINGGGLGYNINRSGANIGYHSWFTTGTERMRIDSSGNVGIGVTPSAWSTVGVKALQLSSTGVFYSSGANTYVGSNSYYNGTNTILIATGGASLYASEGSNLVFYNAPSGTAGNAATFAERMRIDAGGNLSIGTTGKLIISPNGSAGAAVAFWDRVTTTSPSYIQDFRNGGTTVGYISYTNTAVSYITSSDYRLKENIAPMTGALETVAQLKPCTYKWKTDGSEGQGFIAHELAEVVPQCVTGEKDAVDEEGNPKYQGIDTSFLVATLTAAIQEQQVMIEQLKAEVAALKG